MEPTVGPPGPSSRDATLQDPFPAVRFCPRCGDPFDDPSAAFCPQDGFPLPSTTSSDPYVGQLLLDQFVVVARIGAGGMGVVYRARQLHLDRDVAIKVLRPELWRNAGCVSRF